jgi:hypothetical protein
LIEVGRPTAGASGGEDVRVDQIIIPLGKAA